MERSAERNKFLKSVSKKVRDVGFTLSVMDGPHVDAILTILLRIFSQLSHHTYYYIVGSKKGGFAAIRLQN